VDAAFTIEENDLVCYGAAGELPNRVLRKPATTDRVLQRACHCGLNSPEDLDDIEPRGGSPMPAKQATSFGAREASAIQSEASVPVLQPRSIRCDRHA